MRLVQLHVWILFLVVLVIFSCKKTDELTDFTEADEILLGEKLAAVISESQNYAIIPTEGNSIPYGYANSRLLELVNSSSITKGEDFIWTITLLEDESRQAFALPGGYFYVTTGMIFYLENEDQFSGLLAHLVAHINQSHITERLFFKYGVNGLKNIATSGDPESLNEIIEDLDLFNDFIQLSRASELQADTLAITILGETDQSCESSGIFLSRILNVQPTQQIALINSHRVEESRVDNIEAAAMSAGCDTSIDAESANRYRSFRNSLP
ncbi:M48 family metallopeptidase [Ekhidna sp.]|uniref:M48 family metallopeptidase n=1 Tax=Ekhidna sp. TaxID=2608089 RepID=UPI0032980C63